MASVVYPKAKEAFLQGAINMSSGTIKAALRDTGAVAYSAAHDFLNDVSAAHVGTAVTLANKSFTNGVFDADDITFVAPAAGTTVEGLDIYLDTGNAATSYLLAFIDTGTGLPLTTNGADIPITWDNGASKIFAL